MLKPSGGEMAQFAWKRRCSDCRARAAPGSVTPALGSSTPTPIAPSGDGSGSLRAASAGRGVGKARKPRAEVSSPSGVTWSPDLPLIPFHESPSLVSFSSPTGSGEMELIMFRIEEKSGPTGPPPKRPARDRDSAGPGGMRVLPAGGG